MAILKTSRKKLFTHLAKLKGKLARVDENSEVSDAATYNVVEACVFKESKATFNHSALFFTCLLLLSLSYDID